MIRFQLFSHPVRLTLLLDSPSRFTATGSRDRALLELLYATGCRASEVSSLKIEDLHLEEQFCTCHGKGNKERVVPLGKSGLMLQSHSGHLTIDLSLYLARLIKTMSLCLLEEINFPECESGRLSANTPPLPALPMTFHPILCGIALPLILSLVALTSGTYKKC